MVRLRIIYRNGELYVPCHDNGVFIENFSPWSDPTEFVSEKRLYLQLVLLKSNGVSDYHGVECQNPFGDKHIVFVVMPLFFKPYGSYLLLNDFLNFLRCVRFAVLLVQGES